MKRVGAAIVCVCAVVIGASLLPTATPGSVMAGIGNRVAPVAHAQFPFPGMSACVNAISVLDELVSNGYWNYYLTGYWVIGISFYPFGDGVEVREYSGMSSLVGDGNWYPFTFTCMEIY